MSITKETEERGDVWHYEHVGAEESHYGEGRHTHVFFTTAFSKHLPGLPLYSSSRVLDDVTLYWYDSHTRLLEVRAPWFKNTGVNLWRINLHEMNYQLTMQRYLQAIKNRLNSSEEYDMLQKKEGCILYDNGTVQGFISEAYNGKLFTHFDIEAAVWETEIPEAQIFVEALNSNKTVNEDVKKELMGTCMSYIRWLKTLRNGTLTKIEKPTVRVMGRSISIDIVTLSCKAYGHYPRDISLKWWRNNQQVPEEEIQRLTLPFPDQTYLSLSTLDITPITEDLYTCEVNHSSLEVVVRHHWKPFQQSLHSLSQDTGGLSFGIVIVLSLTAVLLLFGTVLGLVALDKKRCSASPNDSHDPPVFLITVKRYNPFDPLPNPPMNVISINKVLVVRLQAKTGNIHLCTSRLRQDNSR
ncbi:PREDICTED: major histocompatibility complex class I-related gene protein-like [Nanorana parkeri]|uniref:major histocompatibility complex class I-related gene protein-like n=1 Tax=Nanorana parkeri TaxID=125878 RepID=UPI0008541F37|nr:PREDICTED: major histocompatibility complex class I-related gene protein-like [Nanorana parkeri]